ncbi:MAG: hypothetical protein ACFB0B_19510 [Thermonemataceae bacterium]
MAKEYQNVTGGILINVLRNCAIQIAERKDTCVYWDDIITAPQKEYKKHQFRWIAPKVVL